MPAIAIPIGKILVDAVIAATVVVGGIIVLSAVAQSISDFIEKELADARDKARGCQNCKCRPCVPPVGSIRYRIDWVKPHGFSKPHWPCKGSHVHFFMQRQNPSTCECKFNKLKKVLCLDDNVGPDDFNPSDLGPDVLPM